MTDAVEPNPTGPAPLAAVEADLLTTADIVGITPHILANWLRRERLFGERPGAGFQWRFSLLMILRVAAVKAVIDSVGLPASVAVKAVYGAHMWESLSTGKPLRRCIRRKTGEWVAPGRTTPAAVEISGSAVWAQIAERFAQRFPDAAAELDMIVAAATGDD